MGYNKTDRIIQFKRAYFKDAECTQFSHFKDWGVGLNNSSFDMPSSNNYAKYFIDLQYFEIKSNKYCEGDIVSRIEYDEKMYYEIIFIEGKFTLNNTNMCKAMDIFMLKFCEKEGNIFQNNDLLNYSINNQSIN